MLMEASLTLSSWEIYNSSQIEALPMAMIVHFGQCSHLGVLAREKSGDSPQNNNATPGLKGQLIVVGTPTRALRVFPKQQILHLPLQQSTEEIEAVAVTLQLPNFARWSVFPPQLFDFEKTPIGSDPLDPRSHSSFGLQGHDLICMEPVFIVGFFQPVIKAGP